MTQLCSVCGHGIYYHVKGGQLDPQACLVSGLNCASHTFASSVDADFSYLLKKQDFKAEPIAYYSFDSTPNDAGGQSNDGTWTGTPAYTTGIIEPTTNGAADLDGAKRITLANEGNFDFERTDPFSISLWSKSPSNANSQALVAKRAGAADTGWELRLTALNTIRFMLTNTLDTNEIDVTGSLTLPNDVWHSTLVTYDGSSSASGVNIYHDGVRDTSITITDDTLSASILNNVAVTLGARNAGARPFTGQLDGLAIWDYQLDFRANEAEYNNGVGVEVLT